MSDFETNNEYLAETFLTSTDTEIQSEKTEQVESNVSKNADKSIDEKYTIHSENTSTDDIKTYGLSKPKRIILTGILKND
jgi:hypothetical protein